MLNKHLNWKQHITKIANTISKTIGIINKLNYELPENTLLTIYNSLILPHLNYCILAWGYDSKRIYKLQKKAIRIISKSKFYSHSDPILKKLEILKIDDIHYHDYLQQIKFYYKYLNNLLPSYFTNFNFATNATVHNYSTRGCHQIRNSLVKHDFSRKCIRYSLPILINTTPIIILDKITSHSIKGFTTYIKRSCIQKYTVLCQLANCCTCERART